MASDEDKLSKGAQCAVIVLCTVVLLCVVVLVVMANAPHAGRAAQAMKTPLPSATTSPALAASTQPPADKTGREEAEELTVVVETAPARTGEVRKCRGSDVRIRSMPSTQDTSNVVGFLSFEQRVTVTGQVDGHVNGEDSAFYSIKAEGLPAGGSYYVYAHYLVPTDAVLYGRGSAERGSAVVSGKQRRVTDDLVDVRWYIENIEVSLILAGADNITGVAQYSREVPLLQRDTAKKLLEASRRYAEDGYTIKLYDAYRPLSVQRTLFSIVKDSSYIANPDTTASNHNRGAAVDMSLIGPDGAELEMPTPMHTFSKQANRSESKSWSEQVRRNVDYMTEVMLSCGFTSIKSEWWHFTDKNHASYMTTDHDFNDIPMYTAEEMQELEDKVE